MKDASLESVSIRNGITTAGEEMIIPVSIILPDPEQPRTEFDPTKLNSLATSIGSVGQKVPISVKANPNHSGTYIIVDGERRWRACQIAEVHTMRVIEKFGTEEELFIESVIANANREGLNVMDTVRAVAKIKSMTKGTNEQVATYFGELKSWVEANLSILRLPAQVHELMSPPIPQKKRLSFSVALLLVALPPQDAIDLAYRFYYQDIKYNRAKKMIAQKRNDLRIEGVKKVRPHAQYRMISRFCGNLADEADLIIDQPQDHFRTIFQSRPAEQIDDLIAQVDKGMDSLQILKDSLVREKARKRRAAVGEITLNRNHS